MAEKVPKKRGLASRLYKNVCARDFGEEKENLQKHIWKHGSMPEKKNFSMVNKLTILARNDK